MRVCGMGWGGEASYPLPLKDGLAILVNFELCDDHLGRVQAHVHCGTVHLQDMCMLAVRTYKVD